MKKNHYQFAQICLLMIFLLTSFSCQEKTVFKKRISTKVVFLSDRDAPKRQFDIFTMNLDGSQQVNITKEIETIRSISKPQISSDGNRILFIAFDGTRKLLKTMNINGANLTEITDINIDDPDPQFSPDGRQIVFTDKRKNRYQIWIINSDGTGRINLSDNDFDEKDAKFSPNGKQITYISRKNKNYAIGVMNSDGLHKKILTDDMTNNRYPSFSPDGKHIVFSSSIDGDADIYIIKSGGGNLKKLSDNKAHDTEPVYSPDGSKILFLSNVRGMRYRDILVYNLKSNRTTTLTAKLNYINQNHCFSADGKQIFFESIIFGNADIYAVDLNGENLTNISNNPKWDCAPSL